jgi:SAM-dependent methyltransferase
MLWTEWPVKTLTREAVELARGASPERELIIGRIDRYGRVLGLFGELPGSEHIGEADFAESSGPKLEVVLRGNHILVRKDFLGNQASLMREWYSLVVLCDKANVPTVHHVDENHCRLYVNLISGQTLGGVLRDAGTQSRLSEEFWHKVEHQLDLIHACGVANFGINKEDIIVDSNDVPWFTNFERARVLRSTSSVPLALMRDQDRVKFNQLYNRHLLTERSARTALVAQVAKVEEKQGWYSTIDFGNGLIVGPIWITSHGPGRWEFLNRHIVMPLVRGKRVLDLGSNNGVIPMMMLRDGADEVIGVELSPYHAEAAGLVHRIFEWRDMRTYKFTLHNCDMLEILEKEWDKFDVVTAFCSLYYLSSDDMARVVRRASDLAPIMVLQANTLSTPKGGRRERASIAFLTELLEDNGFPEVELFAPPDYNRPLLVGQKGNEVREDREC